jgi:hypothetical protein
VFNFLEYEEDRKELGQVLRRGAKKTAGALLAKRKAIPLLSKYLHSTQKTLSEIS